MLLNTLSIYTVCGRNQWQSRELSILARLKILFQLPRSVAWPSLPIPLQLPRPGTLAQLAQTLAPCLTLRDVGGNYSKHSSRMKETSNAEDSNLEGQPFVSKLASVENQQQGTTNHRSKDILNSFVPNLTVLTIVS